MAKKEISDLQKLTESILKENNIDYSKWREKIIEEASNELIVKDAIKKIKVENKI